MLQTSALCLLCTTLWLLACADTFKLRNLLANSPFLGLATDDVGEPQEDEQKGLPLSSRTVPVRKKQVVSASSLTQSASYFSQRVSYLDFYTTKPDEKHWKGDEKEKRGGTLHNDESDSSKQLERKKRVLKALQSTPFFEILWNVFHVGVLPTAVNNAIDDGLPGRGSNDFWDQLKDFIHNGSFVEIGSGETSLRIASHNSSNTVVAVITAGDDRSSTSHVKFVEHFQLMGGLSNLYLCHLPADQLAPTSKLLLSDYQVMFKNLLLSDLPSLVGTLLPHEFEQLIGRFVSVAWNTFIVTTGDIFKKGYFTHWKSLTHLLAKAQDSVSLSVEISELANTAKRVWGAQANVRAFHLILKNAERPIDPTWCMKKVQTSMEDGMNKVCGLFVSNGNSVLMFGDNSKRMAPTKNTSIALQTLLDLGPLPTTQRQLLVSLLKMQYSRTHSSRNILVAGSGLTTMQYNVSEWQPETGEVRLTTFSNKVARLTDQYAAQLQSTQSVSVKPPATVGAAGVHKQLSMSRNLPQKTRKIVRKVSRPLASKTTISRTKPTETLTRERPVEKTVAVKTVVESTPKTTEVQSKLVTSNPVEQPAEHAADVWRHEVEDEHPVETQHFEDQWSRETDDMLIPQKESQEPEDDDLKEAETRLEGVEREFNRERTFEQRPDELKKPRANDIKKENNDHEIQKGLGKAGRSKTQTRGGNYKQPLGKNVKQEVIKGMEQEAMKQVGHMVAGTESVRIADKQAMKPVDELKGKVGAGNKQGARIIPRGGIRKPLPAQGRQNSMANRGDEKSRYHDSKRQMSQDAAKLGGNTEEKKISTLTRILGIPDRGPEKTQPLMNTVDKVQDKSKSKTEKNEDSKLTQADLPRANMVDMESKRLKRDQDYEPQVFRRRLLAVTGDDTEKGILSTDSPAQQKGVNALPMDSLAQPKGGTSKKKFETKKKYGLWLQHHGDHAVQKNPSSDSAKKSVSVKQLLTKLENTLTEHGSESPDDSQQNGEYHKDLVDGKGSDNNSAPTSPPTASPLQRLRSMREKTQLPKDVGTSMFDAEWSVVQSSISNKKKKNFTVLTYGGDQQTLLGTKIARMFPNTSVLTVIPSAYHSTFTSHRSMLKSLSLSNVLSFSQDLTPEVVTSLHSLPDLLHFQFLGVEAFQFLVPLGSDFVHHLGRILTLARTTFLEVPSPFQLSTGVALLRGEVEMNLGIFRGFVIAALKSAGVTESSVSVIEQNKRTDGSLNELKLLNITVLRMTRTVNLDCADYEASLVVSTPFRVTLKTPREEKTLVRAGVSVSLAFLLKLELEKEERSRLFGNYLELPLHDDMCPLHIVWKTGRLHYCATLADKIHSHSMADLNDEAMTELLKEQLKKEKKPFSFIEYESRKGQISLPLAAAFPNSTFISLESDKKWAYEHFDRVKSKKLFNNAIGLVPSDSALLRKLLESPDFMRFQFLGLNRFLMMILEMPKKEFGTMLGQLFATGLTTLVQMPSSQALSLAFSTFFPSLVQFLQSQKSFLREDHPLPFFKEVELRLAAESARADVTNNVTASVIKPSYGPPDLVHSWQVLKVDIRNLTTTVNHHFDYELDGHSRKYSQICLSNKTGWQVYLIRKSDGFKIPFNALHGISLIALLRMDLLPEMKDMLYDMFVRLPLYEDMAPWNVLFQGGKLTYIDYDTKDVTFNKMVPAAYQVMSMLMNYQRTVSDFGHCNGNARNPYGFPYISTCVESSFDGPCKNPAKPVPCGDYTCRSTYVECLRALNELEFKRNELFKRLEQWQKIGTTAATQHNGDTDSEIAFLENGEWVYNENGIVIQQRKIEKLPEFNQPEVSWRL